MGRWRNKKFARQSREEGVDTPHVNNAATGVRVGVAVVVNVDVDVVVDVVVVVAAPQDSNRVDPDLG